MPFPGFPPETLRFFRQLRKNNSREWFAGKKPLFEEKVKAPMWALVEALNAELAGCAPALVTDPSKAIYRIYRDTRFSADKTPYKTHIAASFWNRALEKHGGAGLYVAVSDKGVDIGGGVYMPGPEQILILRNRIASRWEDFQQLSGGKQVRALVGELHGEGLTRMPKGFPVNHPGGEMLRRKQWYYYVTLEAERATGPTLLSEVTKRFRVMLPFVEFLNEPLLAARKKSERSMLL